MSNIKEKGYSKRVFDNKNYFTDLNIMYTSKEEAKLVIDNIKKIDKSISARVVEKKDKDGLKSQIFIYFDEDAHNKISSGVLKIPKVDTILSQKQENKITSSSGSNQEKIDTDQKRKKPIKNQQPDVNTIKQPPIEKDKSVGKQALVDGVKGKSGESIGESKKSQKSLDQSFSSKPAQASKKRVESQKSQPPPQNSAEPNKKEEEPEKFFKSMDEVPGYLLSRVSKDAQKIMRMGILQIQKEPKKNLEYMINTLRSAQINYDVRVQKEKEITSFMNDLCMKMNERVIEYQNQESDIFIKKIVIEPMNKGKFSKFTNQLQSKGIDEVSYLIFKKIKGKAKKYPFTETLLVKRIKQILEQNKK
jgi:hypothetical protein